MPKKSEAVHTEGTLRGVEIRLEEIVNRLEALRSAMKHERIDELSIKGDASLVKSIELIEHFADQGHRSFRRALHQRIADGGDKTVPMPIPQKRRKKA